METIKMPTAAIPAVSRRERLDNNLKFANDGSLESVDRMLYNISIKCYARVQAMGLGMEFDDVLQEMYVSYIKAREKWNAQGGALFSTYCQTVCMNNFNHAIKKMERDRVHLGLGSIHDFVGNEDGTETDPMEVMAGAAGLDIDSPDARLDGAQQTRAKLASLSQGAKTLVALLLQTEQNENTKGTPKLRELARLAKLEGPELKRVKLEILNTFGVRW